MNPRGCAIGLTGDGVAHVTDSLHIRYTVEKDVVLRLQPTVWHAADCIRERESFRSEVEFQDILTGWGRRSWADWIWERRRRWRPAVWTKYQIEAGPSKGADEV